jgi:hypothetical protein
MTMAITITNGPVIYGDLQWVDGEELDVDAATGNALINQGVAVASGVPVTAVRAGALVGNQVLNVGDQVTISQARAAALVAAGDVA